MVQKLLQERINKQMDLFFSAQEKYKEDEENGSTDKDFDLKHALIVEIDKMKVGCV